MNAKLTQGLSVVALLDGRPGHEKQTMGIIQALKARVDVHTIRIQLKAFSLLTALTQTCRLLLSTKGTAHPQLGNADLLLGTGSRTHLPMLLYKKKYGIPAVTCMTPALHLRQRFDLCFIPEHDGIPESENVMLTVGAPNCAKNNRKHRLDCGLVLLGGVDRKSHNWDSRQIFQMVEKIVKKDAYMLWTISSSPRTPDDILTMVRQLSDGCDNIQFFDYRNTPPGWIEEQYDKNKVVWVTADSISMVYEALTAGCRVGIFPMRWRKENGKFKRNEKLLLRKKLVTSFASRKQDHMLRDQLWDDTFELNEAQRCADRILQKWWPSLLQ